jgi:hypothetical protein
MKAARVVLEVNNLDEVTIVGFQLLLVYPLSHNVRVIVNTDNRIAGRKLPEEFVVVHFEDTDASAFLFFLDLRLLCERLDQILDMTLFADKDVKGFLRRLVSLARPVYTQGSPTAYLLRDAFR